jgi:glycosyltransferase involved in cell wall biosynthesis
MRILHVIPSISPTQGGPSFAIPLIATALSGAGLTVDIATTDDDGGERLDVPLNVPFNRQGANYFCFKRQTHFYKFSWPITRWLAANVSNYDLVHIHALFSYATCAAAFHAKRARVPYIVRPLGALNHWGMLNRRRRLKALSFRIIESRILGNAAAIHYTSEQERMEATQAGVTATGAVVPLGIDVDAQAGDRDLFLQSFPQAAGRRIILFLSRIDPKKGLDILLSAFVRVRQQDSSTLLVIAGDGKPELVRDLKALSRRLGIASDILWPGFLSGSHKAAALAAAAVFVLPSYSENFGIAPVEALAAGLPCVISDQVGIADDVQTARAGLVVPCQPAALAEALLDAVRDQALRDSMSSNARSLARYKFSIDAMARSLVSLYESVLGDSESRQPALACETSARTIPTTR